MANTYSHCYYHVVFSTKHRADYIRSDIESRIWTYMGGIARKQGFTAMKIGGIENHLHALLSIPPSILVSNAVKLLKGDSSFWIKREFGINDFGWQDGYGIFTVSKSDIDRVISYIERQRDHHSRQSFEDEYIELLKLHQIDHDEQYVLG